MVDIYQLEFNRTPKVAVIQHLLTECMQAISPQVEQVRTSPTRKQIQVSRRHQVESKLPTYFAVIRQDKFFYGRIIAEVQLGTLLEFYDVSRKKRLTLTQLQLAEPESCLFRYVHRASFFSQPQWRVIGNLPVKKNYPFPMFFLLNGMLDHPKKRLNQRAKPSQIRELAPTKMYSGDEITASLVKYGYKRTWPDVAQLRKQVLKVQFPDSKV